MRATTSPIRRTHWYSIPIASRLAQEFRRYFDTSLMRRRYRDLLLRDAGDGRRGTRFVRAMLHGWRIRAHN